MNERRRPDEAPPSIYELTGEIAEVGRLVVDHWRSAIEDRTIGRHGIGRRALGRQAIGHRAAGALEGSVQITSRALASVGRPAAAFLPTTNGPSRPHEQRTSSSGRELLRRSADLTEAEQQHPAFRRILTEIAPDEARILRLLCVEGAQPLVDVKRGLPPATRLVRTSLTMVDADAGCRYRERVPAYLNNLARLGLVAISDTSVDALRYQLLEVQPEVADALEAAGRTGRTARRRIELTPFGLDFAVECLDLEPDGSSAG